MNTEQSGLDRRIPRGSPVGVSILQHHYSNPKSVVIFPSISTPPNPPLSKGRARVGFYILIANHLRLLYMLAINESIKLQLDLPKLEEQIAELADGSKLKLEIVGPVEVRFENRSTTCRAMVLSGDTEVLLGAIPVEDMDVLIDPLTRINLRYCQWFNARYFCFSQESDSTELLSGYFQISRKTSFSN